MKTPSLKSFQYKGRHYRLDHEGNVLRWEAPTDSYELRWCRMRDEKLAEVIKRIIEGKDDGR